MLQMSWPHLPTVPFLPPTRPATLSAHAGAMEMPHSSALPVPRFNCGWDPTLSPNSRHHACQAAQNQGPFQNRGRRDKDEDPHACVGKTAWTSPIGVVSWAGVGHLSKSECIPGGQAQSCRSTQALSVRPGHLDRYQPHWATRNQYTDGP